MYYQNAKKVNPFRSYGCYFFCLGRIAEKVTGKDISPRQIWQTYVVGISEMWMDEDCFIRSPQKIIKYFIDLLDPGSGYDVEYVGWWNLDTGEEFFGSEKMYNYEVLRDNHRTYNHFYLKDFDPFIGTPAEPSEGLTGKRRFLISKE